MKRFLMLTMLAFLAVSVVCGQSKSSKPAKPSGKYAVLQLPAYNNVKNIAEGNSCLYLNTGENVFSVDKVTGEVKVVLTVKDDGTSLYGKDIKAIAADMTSLYYWVGGSGLYVMGNDKPIFASDEIYPKNMEMQPGGESLLIYGRGSHTVCLNLKSRKPTPYWGSSTNSAAVSGGRVYIIATDGNVHRATCINDTIEQTGEFKGVVTIYRTGKRPERFTDPISATVSFIENGTDQYDDFYFLTSESGGNLYAGVENRIYSVPGWTEVANSGDKDAVFIRFAKRDNKAFAIAGGDYRNRFMEFGASLNDNASIKRSKALQTDVLEPKLWDGAADRYFSNNYDGELYIDFNGNLWYVGEYSRVFIYNADGIKGYRSLKGNLVKVE